MPTLSIAVSWLGSALLIATTGYAVAVFLAMRRRLHKRDTLVATIERTPPVTVLKPLHGAEPRLYENLRGFCQQLRPVDQMIFGVRDVQDPAIAIVQRLQQEFAHRAIELVIDPRVHGDNLKVSNLLNMMSLARHDWLLLADSDISVPEDYLVQVTAPLADPAVGIVTCLYRGVVQPGFWSRLGCLFIDEWFAPSVCLAYTFGSTRFAFGSTIALRRETLQLIGGFQVLRDTLADDFWLGELTRQAGLRTVLSAVWVGTEVSETRLTQLWAHELRWLRTIRAISPMGFAMSFVCFTWPVALVGLVLAPTPWNVSLAVVAVIARTGQCFNGRRAEASAAPWPRVLLSPVRDVLLLLEWAVALTGRRVKWRGVVLHACKDGPIRYS